MAAWEEVRRLAADFQRLQASSTAHRLSERNCVELVGRLLDMGLVEVVHTLDGKEYVTPHHLEKEVRDELTAHRGKRYENGCVSRGRILWCVNLCAFRKSSGPRHVNHY